MVGNGKLVGVVTVDLDDVGKSKSGAWNVLGGRVPISLSGVLRTKDGKGQFELQSASLSGVPLPKFLLQEIVAHYTRDEDHPNGIRLEFSHQKEPDPQVVERWRQTKAEALAELRTLSQDRAWLETMVAHLPERR